MTLRSVGWRSAQPLVFRLPPRIGRPTSLAVGACDGGQDDEDGL
jgi:hypothetical protein